MDVYETFYAYQTNGTTPSLRGQKDQYIKDIVHLMKEAPKPTHRFILHKKNARPFCDQTFYSKSTARIDAFAKYLGARVSMEWVRACASKVDPPEAMTIEMSDETSDRHIHVVEPDVSIFLKLLQSNPDTTITFSRTATARYAIHLPLLYNKLSNICTNHPVLWFMIACSIGIPTYDMYTPQTFFCKWKKEPNRKLLNNENIIKTILRPIIQTNGIQETEIQQLIRSFHEMESDFKNTATVNSVDDYMFKRIYAYPTSNEIEHLFDRVRYNLDYVEPILIQKKSDESKQSTSTRPNTRSTRPNTRSTIQQTHSPKSTQNKTENESKTENKSPTNKFLNMI